MSKTNEIWTQGPVGPWHATVRILATEPKLGRHTTTPHDTLFLVHARWTGPPAHGFPPSDRPVQASTNTTLTNHDAAKHVAAIAINELRNGRIPHLRKIARQHTGGIMML